MWSVLFQKIPGIVFEPVYILSWIGFTLWFWNGRRKPASRIIALGILLFMIGWRAYLPIISSRYAEALILPSLFLAVFGCQQISTWSATWHWSFLQRHPWLKQWPLGALVFSCVLLVVLPRSNDDYLLQAGATVRAMLREDQRINRIFAEGDHIRRLQYYSGIEEKEELQCVNPDGSIDVGKLRELLRALSFMDTHTFYFFLFERPGDEELSANRVGSTLEEWQCIRRQYTSSKKKKRLSIYRYAPQTKLADTVALAPRNLIANGNFEELSLPEVQVQIDAQLQQSANYQKGPQEGISPQNWYPLNIPSRSRFRYELTTEALAGAYSLLLASDSASAAAFEERKQSNRSLRGYDDRLLAVCWQLFQGGEYQFFFDVKANETSEFSIVVLTKGGSQNISNMVEVARIYLPAKTATSIAIPWQLTNQSFYIGIKLNYGNTVFDNIYWQAIH